MTWCGIRRRYFEMSSQVSPLDKFHRHTPTQKDGCEPCIEFYKAPMEIVQRIATPFGRYETKMPDGSDEVCIGRVCRHWVNQWAQRSKCPKPSQPQGTQGRNDQEKYERAFAHKIIDATPSTQRKQSLWVNGEARCRVGSNTNQLPNNQPEARARGPRQKNHPGLRGISMTFPDIWPASGCKIWPRKGGERK
jgi:hypothetical protein